ncbi:TPA: D-2-hydroxyacid dehydrogenase [Candidatus Poribacteria bacterium]|nr:D-2-hydroxyacid dehydrogenase [Candidatus Poribacteria bacterium]HIA70197.1 D-2-hydroxyacid dehydrogenase [Candidatus Poribacteria bacterium]HIB86206.1 D-2-hydroxyacid dehydrogenase [Candidatus Poribacteria bacterium]HIC00981.1 D-2-hydroxyacid dehydrogenase [Candidatus Poribacteria bacterium]HIN31699.1 D-2-hydroxyacid dehydrogenase [Candidatus Poribacteria bacterium]
MKIVVYGHLAEDLQQMIREAMDGNTAIFPESEEALRKEGADAEIFYGFCHERIFQFLPSLKWIQSSSAGMDGHLYPALRDSGVLLTNAAGLYGSHVADQGFALLLSLTRGIHHFVRNQDQKIWGGSKSSMIEIGGFTIGIVGMGGIGQYMANRAKGFDMYVISVDAYRKDKPDVVDELMPIEQLPDLMHRSDVVMIACPLTDETRSLINAENLSQMKPTAYLINVARGPIVDELALIDVLQRGKIAGAGLDVTEIEPLSQESPLWELDNVIITPHAAGGSQHRPRRTVEFFCQNLRRYFNKEPLQNLVDKRLGF